MHKCHQIGKIVRCSNLSDLEDIEYLENRKTDLSFILTSVTFEIMDIEPMYIDSESKLDILEFLVLGLWKELHN